MKVTGGTVSTRNPFGPSWAGQAKQADSVGKQVQDSLFGKPKPKVLDQDDADTAALMGVLHTYRKRLARLAGDAEEDYALLLAEGTIAMIDEQGVIYVGKSFILDHAGNRDVLVGVLAHEIGHRPKRWAQYREQRGLAREEMEQLCKTEETRADYFAGLALAELGLRWEPLASFLTSIQVHPHPEYFPAHLRVEVLQEGFESGSRKAENRRKFFPELARMTSAKGDLGTG
jgi:hypothetical protein